jgi:hypothetical protein
VIQAAIDRVTAAMATAHDDAIAELVSERRAPSAPSWRPKAYRRRTPSSLDGQRWDDKTRNESLGRVEAQPERPIGKDRVAVCSGTYG